MFVALILKTKSSNVQSVNSSYLPKYKDDFLGEAGETGGDGEHESGESKGGVNWDQSCPKGCCCTLAA